MRLGSPCSHHRTQPGISDKSAGKLKNTPSTYVRIPRHHQPPPGGKEVCVLLCYTTDPCVCACVQELYFILYLAVRGNQTCSFFLPSKAVQPATVVPKDFKATHTSLRAYVTDFKGFIVWFEWALGLIRWSEENDLSQTAGNTTEENLTFTQLDKWLKSG